MSYLTLPACFLPIASHYFERKNPYRAKVETGGYLLASPDAPDVIRVATGPGDDGAHLRDALRRAIGMLENQPEDLRRVIIAVSESTDTGSKAGLDSVLRDAELADVSIYTIGLSTTASELRAPPSQASGPDYGPTGTYSRPGVPGRRPWRHTRHPDSR